MIDFSSTNSPLASREADGISVMFQPRSLSTITFERSQMLLRRFRQSTNSLDSPLESTKHPKLASKRSCIARDRFHHDRRRCLRVAVDLRLIFAIKQSCLIFSTTFRIPIIAIFIASSLNGSIPSLSRVFPSEFDLFAIYQ